MFVLTHLVLSKTKMSQYKHVIGFYQILVGLGTSNLNTLTILKWQKGANLTNFCKFNNDKKITIFLHITRMTHWITFWTSSMTKPFQLFQGVYICMSCPVCQARDGRKICHQKHRMISSLPVCVWQLAHGVNSFSWKMRIWSVKSRYL